MKNILVIKLRYTGDVLLLTPTVRAVKAARPDIRVSVMVNRGPSNPRKWGPRGAPAEVIYKCLDCRACFHPTCDQGEMS